MSARKCAREECGKTVYPLEELKCLDKVWHKQCFKCTVCGMTLNMKNYKGYDKMPYCEPHYPKTVASVVTDTPEMRRVAENTRNQSQVQYHAAYEKSKGTKIEVADDPEMERHRKNMLVGFFMQLWYVRVRMQHFSFQCLIMDFLVPGAAGVELVI
ncbi:LIM domain protein [Ancylostoma caninum]|uniref:LIM domain protein n=1 Tax=Ancylostoma caninum TaxID=29170 RepID=A0A368G6E9_ANCCA|nr:LIM domain protein [Ancylostoma caninum]